MRKKTFPNASAGKSVGESKVNNLKKAETTDPQVKYVLYSHISYQETEDSIRFREWENRQEELTKSLGPDYMIVEDLKPFLKELSNLLTDAETPGILILFYAMGYAQCLEEIAAEQRLSREQLMARHAELRCAQSVQNQLQKMFDNAPGLDRRVRVVSAMDLYDTLRRIESGYAQSLIQWFIGLQEEKIRYDAPKIVEATYIDMTLNWSKTIQLIRSIEPGTLKTDLFWKPKSSKAAQ